MKRRYVYLVWVTYRDGTRILSAVFSTRKEAQRFADIPAGEEEVKSQVSTEEVYTSIDDV